MLTAILAVAKELVGYGQQLREAQIERRERLAVFMEKMADCLTAMADQIAEKGNPPHQLCAELEVYGEQAAEILTAAYDSRAAAEIGSRLRDATFSRRIAMETGVAKERDDAIREVYEAAGELRGLSNTLLASPAIRP